MYKQGKGSQEEEIHQFWHGNLLIFPLPSWPLKYPGCFSDSFWKMWCETCALFLGIRLGGVSCQVAKFRSIFSRRFSSEKCPTLTVASFFFVRLQSHSDWATFLTIETTKICEKVQKGPPFILSRRFS